MWRKNIGSFLSHFKQMRVDMLWIINCSYSYHITQATRQFLPPIIGGAHVTSCGTTLCCLLLRFGLLLVAKNYRYVIQETIPLHQASPPNYSPPPASPVGSWKYTENSFSMPVQHQVRAMRLSRDAAVASAPSEIINMTGSTSSRSVAKLTKERVTILPVQSPRQFHLSLPLLLQGDDSLTVRL